MQPQWYGACSITYSNPVLEKSQLNKHSQHNHQRERHVHTSDSKEMSWNLEQRAHMGRGRSGERGMWGGLMDRGTKVKKNRNESTGETKTILAEMLMARCWSLLIQSRMCGQREGDSVCFIRGAWCHLVIITLCVCVSAPLTEEPPRILFPSENKLLTMDVQLGKNSLCLCMCVLVVQCHVLFLKERNM